MDNRIGTCSLCGGAVELPSMMVNPIARCRQCGAVAQNPHGPVVPMQPPIAVVREWNEHLKRLTAVLLVLSMAAPAFAQSSVVADVKAQLVARGVDLNGPCGAFQITRRVAWQLRAQGAGYIRKKAEQNNCELHGVDIIMYRDGRIVDILTDSGGSNGTTWDTSKPPVDPGLWEAPVDPGDATVTPPAEPGSPIIVQPAPVDLQPIQSSIERVFENLNEQLKQIRERQDGLAAQLKAHDEEPTYIRKVLGNHYVQVALAAVGTYFMQRQITK